MMEGLHEAVPTYHGPSAPRTRPTWSRN